VEQQVVTASVESDGNQITVTESATEVTAAEGKKTRAKKVTVERGEPSCLPDACTLAYILECI